jgi:hypothetical protein
LVAEADCLLVNVGGHFCFRELALSEVKRGTARGPSPNLTTTENAAVAELGGPGVAFFILGGNEYFIATNHNETVVSSDDAKIGPPRRPAPPEGGPPAWRLMYQMMKIMIAKSRIGNSLSKLEDASSVPS